jgi:6-pyruvoyltetrahydropterin/6-carboxytetrahydropterin synthase
MIVSIAKRFTFDAAHHLPTLPPDHKCYRMHGHTYQVELSVVGKVGLSGMLIDYADIAQVWEAKVHDRLDHRVLNEIKGLEIPSTEHLAAWIFCHVWPELEARFSIEMLTVRVYESTTTWCEIGGGAELLDRDRDEHCLTTDLAL